MAILGVGMDLADTRIFSEELLRPSSAMLEELFSPRELEEIRSAPNPPHTAAGKFAAKEALHKALSGALPWEEVSGSRVIHDERGAPKILPSESVRNHLSAHGEWRIHLSISHEDGMAAAVVVVEVL